MRFEISTFESGPHTSVVHDAPGSYVADVFTEYGCVRVVMEHGCTQMSMWQCPLDCATTIEREYGKSAIFEAANAFAAECASIAKGGAK